MIEWDQSCEYSIDSPDSLDSLGCTPHPYHMCREREYDSIESLESSDFSFESIESCEYSLDSLGFTPHPYHYV